MKNPIVGYFPATRGNLENQEKQGNDTSDQSTNQATEAPDEKNYPGSGIDADPFLVGFQHHGHFNPMNFSPARKWLITSIGTLSVFAITLTSSAYSGSARETEAQFEVSAEVFTVGIALFVLGFAVGPALWAPLSELYGRRIWFIITHALVVAFVAASAGCENITSLLIFRFLAGTFGASTLTNSGGVIADLFPQAERGLGLSIFATAPFMGPVLGPMVGGFITITVGWRWVQGVCAIFIGIVWIVGTVLMPETYAPVILQNIAKKLSRENGKVYISVLNQNNGSATVPLIFSKTLKRPWVLLFREPIVLIA